MKKMVLLNGENIQELEGIIDKCIQNTDEVILKKTMLLIMLKIRLTPIII